MNWGFTEKKIDGYSVFLAKDVDFDIKQNSEVTRHLSANPYGDWAGLATVLRMMVDENPNKSFKILEVGTAHGHFVRTMYEFTNKLAPGKVQAFGMDSKLHGYCPCQISGPNMKFIDGKSTDENVINSLDNDFDFIFIDGCHCENHAYYDAINYSKKLRKGGYIGFHDSSPRFQGLTEQPRTPECSEDTHIGVVKGINRWAPTKNGFEFVLEEYHTDDKYFGGVTVYRKL